jgi:hypothetical protein
MRHLFIGWSGIVLSTGILSVVFAIGDILGGLEAALFIGATTAPALFVLCLAYK